MKKQSKSTDELRQEYGADFFKDMKPNRFADRIKLGRVRERAHSAKRAIAKKANKKP